MVIERFADREGEKSDEGEGQMAAEGGHRFDGTEFVGEPEYL